VHVLIEAAMKETGMAFPPLNNMNANIKIQLQKFTNLHHHLSLFFFCLSDYLQDCIIELARKPSLCDEL